MKTIFQIFLCMILFFGASVSFAQLPGNYNQSCYQCQFYAGTLSCLCNTRNQVPQRTVLNNAPNCGFIENLNGNLTCRQWNNYGHQLPPGNYTETCSRCQTFNDNLSCACQTTTGNMVASNLAPIHNCRYIKNLNGNLTCVSYRNSWHQHSRMHFHPQHKDFYPQGSYQETCRRCDYRHGLLKCRCQTSNGNWIASQLFTRYCHTVGNINGVLTCLG